MDNFEHHKQARVLADCTTPYNLARKLLEIKEALSYAIHYISSVEDSVESCGYVVADQVWEGVESTKYCESKAKELLE